MKLVFTGFKLHQTFRGETRGDSEHFDKICMPYWLEGGLNANFFGGIYKNRCVKVKPPKFHRDYLILGLSEVKLMKF